ncbi:putative membrane protein [Nostocoides japonicum T1-X7]|uniref:Putative membrane protein n=1 Tax=Nostocoides japonicum T1-X7 TaxID=1194083 RepID=A0A077LUA3_9MICO|nr:putative membrane protein [Tetrasphaera japonica T1-X7]
MIGNIIGTIIFGAILGMLARLVLPGKQNISVVMTVLCGIIGAIVGYWLAAALNVRHTGGIDWIRDLISVIVAALAIVAYGAISGRKQTT